MRSHPPLRALLVEDEHHARTYLRELLAQEDGIAIVGEAATGTEGAALIRTLAPDLVFLDIQMPELDGFGMLDAVGAHSMPAFVFVTAFQEYAVRAFEVDAVDYLCKPFDRSRLSAAVQRAKRYLRARDTGPNAGQPEDRPSSRGPWLSRVTVKEDAGITFVPVQDILFVQAANKYVVIQTSTGRYIARQTIQSLASQLDPRQFVRIHRSVLVRKAVVRGLHPLFHGDYIVKLTDGTELTLSRTFRDGFFQAMGR
jgi:two-component system LytT family response regulator